MKSETKANWIFLTVFTLIMAPGLSILARKAYKKGAAGMNPPAPQSVSAYNNPNPQDPSWPRAVPPETKRFVDSIIDRLLKLQPQLVRADRSASSNPLLSEAKTLEYLGGGAGDEKYYVALLGWDRHFAPLPSLYEFVAARGAQKIPAKMSAYEGANLPIDLRSELQRYGYILPPDSVIWIILEVPGSEPIDSVSVHYKIDRKTIDDRIILAPTAASRPIED